MRSMLPGIYLLDYLLPRRPTTLHNEVAPIVICVLNPISGGNMKGKIALNLTMVFACCMSLSAATIPDGTHVTIRTGSSLSSASARSGEAVSCSVAHDVIVHGKTLARSGDPARCRVTSAKSSGRLHAPGILRVRLTSVNGQDVT